MVDCLAARLRRAPEVELLERRAVRVAHEAEEVGAEADAVGTPKPVGHGDLQLVAPGVVPLGEDRGLLRRGFGLIRVQVESLGHLLGRVAAGAEVRHAERDARAGGREEEIAGLATKHVVERHREAAVVGSSAIEVGVGHRRRMGDDRVIGAGRRRGRNTAGAGLAGRRREGEE